MSEGPYITRVGRRSFKTADNETYVLTPEARDSICGIYGIKFLTNIRNREEFQKMRDSLKVNMFNICPKDGRYIISIMDALKKRDVVAKAGSIDVLADGDLSADAGELVEQAYHESVGEEAAPEKPKKKTTRLDQNPIWRSF